jgi:hypothetical protein
MMMLMIVADIDLPPVLSVSYSHRYCRWRGYLSSVDATRDASSVDNMEDKVYGSVRCVRMGAMRRQEAAKLFESFGGKMENASGGPMLPWTTAFSFDGALTMKPSLAGFVAPR